MNIVLELLFFFGDGRDIPNAIVTMTSPSSLGQPGPKK